jgi:hypothetical protein
MFGFGRGFRGRRFFGRGGGFGYRYFARFQNVPVLDNEKYEYVGTCRCGLGPHAYYRDRETGNIVPAVAVYGNVPNESEYENEIKDRLKYLEEEKKYLEEEIKKLKESLKKE